MALTLAPDELARLKESLISSFTQIDVLNQKFSCQAIERSPWLLDIVIGPAK